MIEATELCRIEEIALDCTDLLGDILCIQAIDYAQHCQAAWLQLFTPEVVEQCRHRLGSYADQHSSEIRNGWQYLQKTI